MKKNSIALAFYFLAFWAPLWSQQAAIIADISQLPISARLVLKGYSGDELISSIEAGNTAQIVFDLRLYREITGPFSIFGDRIVQEHQVQYLARWDRFSTNYIMSEEGDNWEPFNSKDAFLQHLFSTPNLSFTPPSGKKPFFLLGRISVTTEVLVPPMNILTPFLQYRDYVSPWIKMPISGDALGQEDSQ